jgi:hypothetical protein
MNEPVPGKGPRRFTRRRLLETAIVAAPALTLAAMATPDAIDIFKNLTSKKEEDKPKTPEDLIHELEEAYPIQVDNPLEVYTQNEMKKFRDDNPDFPEKWDLERLSLLKEGFEKLPAKFTKPYMGDKKLIITLSPPGLPTSYDIEEDISYLNYKTFSLNSKRESLITLTRSQVIRYMEQARAEKGTMLHIKIRHIFPDFDNYRFTARKKMAADLDWFSGIESKLDVVPNSMIAKQNLNKTLEEERLSAQILELWNPRQPKKSIAELKLVSAEEDKAIAYFCLLPGMNKEHGREIVLGLSQVYVQGKDYFYNWVGKFYDPEKTDSLYKFIKENIFQDQEYSPLI